MTVEGDAKETVGGLPDLRLSPLFGQTIFHPFACNAMEISEHKNRDWSKDFMCFSFPVNSSAKQFLGKISATLCPGKGYSTVLLASLVQKLWTEVEIQLHLSFSLFRMEGKKISF